MLLNDNNSDEFTYVLVCMYMMHPSFLMDHETEQNQGNNRSRISSKMFIALVFFSRLLNIYFFPFFISQFELVIYKNKNSSKKIPKQN